MTEMAPLSSFDIDYDAQYPKSLLYYPLVNVLSTPQGSELVAVSVKHFNGTTMTEDAQTENWQFPIFRDLLEHAAHASPHLPTIAFNEGLDRTRFIDMQDSVEAALAREGDPGMFSWMMHKHNIPVRSWDLSMTDEVSKLLWLHTDGNTPTAEALRSAWPSLNEFKQYIGYFEFSKHTPQYLRQRVEKHQSSASVALGGLQAYVRSRLEAQGVIRLFAEHDIDITEESLRVVHEEVCADAGADLPLDPSEAPPGAYSPGEYMRLCFPPTNILSRDFYADYKRLQWLGSITGHKLRNEHLAELLTRHLPIPQHIIVAAGERHAMEALRIMLDDTEGCSRFSSLETYIGEVACRDYVRRDLARKI